MPNDVVTSPLRRRPGIDLIHTGSWSAMTGTWNPTPADIAAAIEAQSCPAIRKPVIKLGHTDGRFPTVNGDGEPALGWFENLRAPTPDSLVGDQVTLPWLDDVQAAAYPSRSIEGNYNHRCSEGHVHPFVITAVALLGVTPPAVQTLRNLNDLQDLLGVAAATEVPDGAEAVQVTINAAAEVGTGAMVALIPTAEDAARLAVEGGEPAEQLHCTIAYLGKAADIPTAVRQDVIDSVSTAVNGMPVVDAEGFALSVFNPGDHNDRDTCIVLGLGGDLLDAVHTLLAGAVGFASPAQHAPWVAHLTLQYTDDLSVLARLVDRIGPVRFDRVRVVFGGDIIDIPLIGEDDTEAGDDDFATSDYVAAAAGEGDDENSLRHFFTKDPRGLKRWARKAHPWTSLFKILREHLDPERAKRVTSSWYRLVFGRTPNQKKPVAASEQPPTAGPMRSSTPEQLEPTTPPGWGGVPVSPGAEPEPTTEPKGEDPVSTLSADVRNRLGLPEDADDAAVLAAFDALKVKADTPQPDPQAVAAAAARDQENEELRKEVQVLASQMQTVTAELAAAKATQVAAAKATVLDDAVRTGRIAPADRDRWATDYDEAPAVVTRVLASIAPGTAVPVTPAGTTGTGEEAGVDDEYEKLCAAIDGPYATRTEA